MLELHAVCGPFRLDLLTLGFGLLHELHQATLVGGGSPLAFFQAIDFALLILALPLHLLALGLPALRARQERLVVSGFDLGDRQAMIGLDPRLLAFALPDKVIQALLFGDRVGVALLEIGDLEPLALVLLPDLFVLVAQDTLALGQGFAAAGLQFDDGAAVLRVDTLPLPLPLLDELGQAALFGERERHL